MYVLKIIIKNIYYQKFKLRNYKIYRNKPVITILLFKIYPLMGKEFGQLFFIYNISTIELKRQEYQCLWKNWLFAVTSIKN